MSEGRDGKPAYKWAQVRRENHLLDALTIAVVCCAVDGADPATSREQALAPAKVRRAFVLKPRHKWA